MKYALILVLALAGALAAQEITPQVNEVVPGTLYLEAGGKQINSVLRGSNLQLLTRIQVLRQGKVVPDIYTLIGPAAPDRRTITFIASPQCFPAGDYQVLVKGGEASQLLPFVLVVVKAGDPRASLPDTATLAETVKTQNGSRIVVSEPLAPVITGTVPAPLIIAPSATLQKVLIQGRNLRDITEVRVRKADSNGRYKGNQGILPFRKLPEGIEVDVTAGANTAMGSRFVLDLMVKKYLAASVTLTIGAPAPPAPAAQPVAPPEPLVIPLGPSEEKTP